MRRFRFVFLTLFGGIFYFFLLNFGVEKVSYPAMPKRGLNEKWRQKKRNLHLLSQNIREPFPKTVQEAEKLNVKHTFLKNTQKVPNYQI